MIRRIVVTGGPGSGKTVGIQYVTDQLRIAGYLVMQLPEVASLCGAAGVQPCPTIEFQDSNIGIQLVLEDELARLGQRMYSGRPIILLCDRGVLDGRAYVPEEEFDQVLWARHNLTCDQAMLRYRGVIHMCSSVAVGGYSRDNNPFRSEDAHEAAQLCDKLHAQWSRHPAFVSVPASPSFTTKLATLHKEVLKLL